MSGKVVKAVPPVTLEERVAELESIKDRLSKLEGKSTADLLADSVRPTAVDIINAAQGK